MILHDTSLAPVVESIGAALTKLEAAVDVLNDMRVFDTRENLEKALHIAQVAAAEGTFHLRNALMRQADEATAQIQRNRRV